MRAGRPPQSRPRGRSAAIADGLAFMARWSLRLALIGIGFALLWWLIARLWVIVMPVLLALLISTVLYPPARWLRRRGAPPALAAATVVLGALLLVGIVIYLPRDVHHWRRLRDRHQRGGGTPVDPELDLRAAAQHRRHPVRRAPAAGHAAAAEQRHDHRHRCADAASARSPRSSLPPCSRWCSRSCSSRTATGSCPWLRRIVGPRAGGHLTVILGQVWGTLGGFIRGQVLVSLCRRRVHRDRPADRRRAARAAAGRADLHRRVHPDRRCAVRRRAVGARRAGQQRLHGRADRARDRAARAAGGGQRPAADPAGQEPQPARRGGAARGHRRRHALRHRRCVPGRAGHRRGGDGAALPVRAGRPDVGGRRDRRSGGPGGGRARQACRLRENSRAWHRRTERTPRPGGRRRRAGPRARCRSPGRTRRTPSNWRSRTTAVRRDRGPGAPHTTTRIGRPRASRSSPSTSAAPRAHRCADQAPASASSTSSSRAPDGRSPSASAGSTQRASAAIRCPAPRADFFGAKSVVRAPACAAPARDAPRRRGRAAPRRPTRAIFGVMWNVCRLIARPVSLRATAHASA